MIIGAAVATIGLVGALVFYGTQSEYGVLFSDLKPADAQTIIEKLKTDGVKYQVSNGGTTISVPQERISELRLQVASSAFFRAGTLALTSSIKQVSGQPISHSRSTNQRAIEGELARQSKIWTRSNPPASTSPSPRIHLRRQSRTRQSFGHDSRPPGRELSRERTEAVTNLISSAVESLDRKTFP